MGEDGMLVRAFRDRRRKLFKPDHARAIDRCIDYFGETIGVPAECEPCRERSRGSES